MYKGKSDYLWFNAGGVSHDDTFKMTLLCDSRNERFRNEIKSFYERSGRLGEYTPQLRADRGANNTHPASFDEKLEAARMLAAENTIGGVRIDFKREEPWLFIADWIIDSYHGRLYKITENQK